MHSTGVITNYSETLKSKIKKTIEAESLGDEYKIERDRRKQEKIENISILLPVILMLTGIIIMYILSKIYLN